MNILKMPRVGVGDYKINGFARRGSRFISCPGCGCSVELSPSLVAVCTCGLRTTLMNSQTGGMGLMMEIVNKFQPRVKI